MQRVALVGTGGMGMTHAMQYTKMKNAKLVAVMDTRPECVAAAAEKTGAKPFTDADRLFNEAEFDVIDVCTPTPWHLPYIKMGAEAGKHVCSEKPFCRTVEQCQEAIDVCKKAGVQLFVAHVVRWFPEFVKAKDLVESGSIGNPAIVRTTRGGGFPHASGNWFANFEWSGGSIMDLSIHDIDWLLWVFGPAERVFAKGLYFSGIPDKDYALVTIRFKSGVIAHVESSWATPGGFKVLLEIAGDKGMISFDNQEAVPLVIGRFASEESSGGVPVPSSPTHVSPYYLELQHFIDCIEEGRTPDVKPEEAMAAVALCSAAIESIRTGKPVEL